MDKISMAFELRDLQCASCVHCGSLPFDGPSCEILDKSMIYDRRIKELPKEWKETENGLVCSEWKDNGKRNERNTEQLDLF